MYKCMNVCMYVSICGCWGMLGLGFQLTNTKKRDELHCSSCLDRERDMNYITKIVCMYVYMYVRMYVCIHIYIYIYMLYL